MRAVRWVGFLLVLSFLGGGTWAMAQTGGPPPPPSLDRSFDVQLFHPAVGARSFITLDGARVLEHRLWHVGLITSYARQPLTYTLQSPVVPREPTTLIPVQNLAMAELVGAMGWRNRFEVGVAVPVALTWAGSRFDGYGRDLGGSVGTAAAFGDVRVEGKAELLGFGRGRAFQLSVSAGATLPTGDENAFLGERTLSARGRLLLEYQRGERIRALLMAGGWLRETSRFLGTPAGPAGLYGAAVEYRPTLRIGVLAEATGRVASRYSDTNPAELDAAMRFYLPSLVNLIMGAGFGLNQGPGSPILRAFVGLGWAPDQRDRDHDGILDRLDRCPEEAEDRDGFQDDDGCIDADNDLDGVPDGTDRCPNDPEDRDQFEDDDGCPDLDNDRDGIDDLHDACPSAKEDGRGKQTTDGCPSTTEDADRDGLHDAIDKCPDEPEDQDGFEDGDGCPDHDNDGDGIPDAYDACPSEAEDGDGWEDDDGCPDPDNDHDGLADTLDRCPNKPETINYYRDEDGCPDPGPELVRLGESDAKVFLAAPISFRTGARGKPQLTMNGNMMVALAARLLNGHTEVALVRVEVRGKETPQAAAQEQAEVLCAGLVRNGVAAGRLQAVGLPPGPKRVELVIAARSQRSRNPVPTVAPSPSENEAGSVEDAPTGPENESPRGPGLHPDEEAR